MNDIVAATSARTNLFADDTSTFVCDTSLPAVESRLQVAVSNLEAWFNSWGLSVNISKSAVMVMSTRRQSPKWINIQINGSSIPQVTPHKHLGLLLNDQLKWSDHVTYIVNKASKKIGLLRRLRSRLDPIAVQSVYKTCVRPTMEYASLAWSGVSATDSDRLERLQRSAARLIVGVSPLEEIDNQILLARAGLEPLSLRRNISLAQMAYRLASETLRNREPSHFAKAFKTWSATSCRGCTSLSLRSSLSLLRLPRPRTELMRRSPFYAAFSLLNSLPEKSKESLSSLKSYFSFPGSYISTTLSDVYPSPVFLFNLLHSFSFLHFTTH